jgi:glycosyltransferase involved in cell wall biosynthesis
LDNTLKTPLATVLMPVYNAESYVSEAIESILNQTFTDFEFLIIDDASTDTSLEIIQQYSDKRIRLISNATNLGIAQTLNKGIDLAKGKYIARMDADDISEKDRLEKQIGLLENYPEFGLCGSWIKIMGTDKIVKLPCSDEELQVQLLKNSPFAHPGVIFRANIIKKNALYYNPVFSVTEDYELWTKISKHTKLCNIPEPLLEYRLHNNQATRLKKYLIEEQRDKIRLKQIEEIVPNITYYEKELHLHFIRGKIFFTLYKKVIDMIAWLNRLQYANKQIKRYNQKVLRNWVTGYQKKMILQALNNNHYNFSTIRFLLNNNVPTIQCIPFFILLKTIVKSTIHYKNPNV